MTKTAPVKKAPLTSLKGVAELLGDRYTPELREAFPDVIPPYAPLGYLVLVQLRQPKKKVGSIIVPDAEHDVERYRVQASLVRALGPMCFRDRTTGAEWIEGAWYAPGDFIRNPMYGGDRFDAKIPGGKGDERVTFAFFRESDAVALVTGDPLTLQTS